MEKFKIRPWSKMERYMNKWSYFMSSFRIRDKLIYSVEYERQFTVPFLPGRFDVVVNQGWRIYHSNTKNHNFIIHRILSKTQDYFPEANVKCMWVKDTSVPTAVIFLDNRKYNELRRTFDYANSLYAPYAFFIRLVPNGFGIIEPDMANEFFTLTTSTFDSKFETVDQIIQISRDYFKEKVNHD
ncbi:hypothetical protein [Proteus mirabilis]|uniref:hypothetical protein n=1 Tax=Proteus mirabilis TaxID=584 RepID=UPI0034D551CC